VHFPKASSAQEDRRNIAANGLYDQLNSV